MVYIRNKVGTDFEILSNVQNLFRHERKSRQTLTINENENEK